MAIGHPHSRSRSTKVGVPPGRVACVRTSHERTRQIDETFKYFINLAWHRKYKDSMHLAGSRESWRLSPRVNQSANDSRISIANQHRESAARQRTRRTTTNESNESGEWGQFVHFKESFIRTDSFANEPTLVGTIGEHYLARAVRMPLLVLDKTKLQLWELLNTHLE